MTRPRSVSSWMWAGWRSVESKRMLSYPCLDGIELERGCGRLPRRTLAQRGRQVSAEEDDDEEDEDEGDENNEDEDEDEEGGGRRRREHKEQAQAQAQEEQEDG
eukprot:2225406-Rhodomonas_salina.1